MAFDGLSQDRGVWLLWILAGCLDRTTNRRIFGAGQGFWGYRVAFRFKQFGVIAALAAGLCGCSKSDLDNTQAWFAKPLDLTGRNAGGYSFSELAETKQHQRPITANDLVDNNGACPAPAAAQAQAQTQGAPAAPSGTPNSGALLGGGIALGMSECDVVFRAGTPSQVQLGKNPNGDRTAVLTFTGGPRPGIYRFERGSLMTMDRVAAPAPPPEAKSKAAKTSKSSKKGDQS